MEEWKNEVLRFMQEYKKVYVPVMEIEKHIKARFSSVYEENGAYFAFAPIMKMLEEDGKIIPNKARGDNHQSPAIFNWYKLLKEKEGKDAVHIKRMMTEFPFLNMSGFYQKSEFEKWGFYLIRLHLFLSNDGNSKRFLLKANERSYELFQEEKFLLSKEGMQLLGKLGLTLTDLSCRRTNEPFVEYRIPHVAELKTIFIIENRDTFDSVKEAMMKGIRTWFGYTFDMVIYGEGDKINRSYSFLEEYDLAENYEVFYFGDLDSRGIYICTEVMKKDDCVRPFVPFYQYLLDNFADSPSARELKKQLKPSEIKESFERFSIFFSEEGKQILEKSTKIVRNMQYYIPQEGVNIATLYELGGGNDWS